MTITPFNNIFATEDFTFPGPSIVWILPFNKFQILRQILGELLLWLKITKSWNSSPASSQDTLPKPHLLVLLTNGQHNIDSGLISGVLFLDCRKVFNTVNYGILISKVELYSERGHSLEWFESYLSKRKQICTVNGQLSDVTDWLWRTTRI